MRVHRIELPTPFPVGPVNAYLLEGTPLTLVDTGPKTEAAQTALETGVRDIGRRIEDIRRIILTHGHSDHFGSAQWVASRSGAQVFAHPSDRPKFAGDRWVNDHLRTHFLAAGLPESFLGTFTERMRAMRRLFDAVTTFQPVGDGDTLDADSSRLRVLHCPGHSLGHICLYHDDGVLIAGDLLLEEISPNPIVEFDERGTRIPTLPQYLHSLRRILLLNCDVAYPGHGGPIANPNARIRELIAHHEQRKEAIYGRLDARGKTLVQLCRELYQNLDELNLMLALSEVVGHLDLLMEEKRATASRRGGILFFRAK
jgi:glyoxylase-like metal-dependent hydrolase (beta-lactamase superfamily II)